MGKTTYVLDTSVLISDPEVLLKLSDFRIIVPLAVIGQLDRLKGIPDHRDLRAKASRRAARILDLLERAGYLCWRQDAVRVPRHDLSYVRAD